MLKEPIKLNMNEMPYPPPRGILKAAQKSLSSLHRYSNTEELERLRRLLADYSAVSEEHIILSPGSDLLLREMICGFSKGRKIITVSPSFFPTVQAAKQFATRLFTIRLSPPDFALNREVLAGQLLEPCLVVIDNPNNPTGKILLDHRTVESVIENRDTLLVIDEAYYEFAGTTFADMVESCPNLAITRTMDKAFGLAGARVGYAIAGKAFLDELSSFPALLPQPSLYAAIEALKNPNYMRRNVYLVMEEKKRLWRTLNKLGVHTYQSATNFLLVKTEIPDMATELRDVGILVSDLSDQLPPGFIRVSIGTHKESDAFVDAYARIREAHH